MDRTARALAERVKDSLGPVIVENNPARAATSVPTWSPGHARRSDHWHCRHRHPCRQPWLYAKMPYNAATDFAPVTQMVAHCPRAAMNAETAWRPKIHHRRLIAPCWAPTPANSTTAVAVRCRAPGPGNVQVTGWYLRRAHPLQREPTARFALQSAQVDFNFFDNLLQRQPGIGRQLKALAVTTPPAATTCRLATRLPTLGALPSIPRGLVALAATPGRR